MSMLDRKWKSNKISFSTKLWLYRSLVVSILYGWEKWTLQAVREKRIWAFENKCLRRLLQILHIKCKTIEEQNPCPGLTSKTPLGDCEVM